MRSDEIAAKREQRKDLRAQMQEIVDQATLAGRDLTEDENRAFDRMTVEYRKLGLELDGVKETAGGGFVRLSPDGSLNETGLAAAFRSAGWQGREAGVLSWPEFRAFTWTGSVDNISQVSKGAVGLGADQRYLYPVIPQVAVGSDVTSISVLSQSARSLATAANVIRAIDAVTNKPETGSTMTTTVVPMKQIANVNSGTPNIVLEQAGADSVIEQDLRLAVSEGLDKLVIDSVAASGFQAPGTDVLLLEASEVQAARAPRRTSCSRAGGGSASSRLDCRVCRRLGKLENPATAARGASRQAGAPAGGVTCPRRPLDATGLGVLVSRSPSARDVRSSSTRRPNPPGPPKRQRERGREGVRVCHTSGVTAGVPMSSAAVPARTAGVVPRGASPAEPR